MKTSLKRKEAIIENVCELVRKGSKMINLKVPKSENIEIELIRRLAADLNDYSILIATERENEIEMWSGLKGVGTHFSVVNFQELFDKRIEINGKVKNNRFDLIVINQVPHGRYDQFTAPEERLKTSTLTNRINYIYGLYGLQIVSLSKTDSDSELRIHHFTKKVD